MTERVIPILLFAFMVIFSTRSSAIAASDYLTYEEFIILLQQDKIKSVDIVGARINGIYVEDTREKEFSTHYRRDASNDPLLMELLNEKGVEVSVKDEIGALKLMMLAILTSLLMVIVPIVILVFVLRINVKVNRLIKKETQPH